MDRTDVELIQAIQNGDRTAAEDLVRRHLPRVRSTVYSLVLNNDVTDDLTQDVFAQALRGLKMFRGQSAFETWLYRIAMNVACGFLRQSVRRKTTVLSAESVDEELPAPDATLIALEGKDRIEAALARLAPPLRAAIVLTAMQGLSAIEASQIEKCSVGTMYWRIHEARRRLRQELKEWIE